MSFSFRLSLCHNRLTQTRGRHKRHAPMINSHRRRVMAIGLTILVLAVNVGISFGGYFLGLLGVLAGANLISVGVNMADDGPAAFSGLVASITAYVRLNLAAVGLFVASSAVMAVVDGELGPVLCFAVFTLLLLGISLVTLGVLGQIGV